MKKTFLLGVGCQKGGTTWLSSYLVKHPQCAMGIAKEYHTFDVLASTQQRHLLKRTMLRLITNLQDAVKAIEAAEALDIGPDAKLPLTKEDHKILLRNMKKTEFCFDLSDYVRYFKGLSEPDQIRLTGDITPEYAVLSADNFRSIRKLIEDSGRFDCKVVFMMRDPIERILSSEKMSCRRLGINEDKAIARTVARYKEPVNSTKSQYEVTIRNLEAVFDPANIHYLFYEELFRDKDIAPTLDFLGLDPLVPPDFGHNPLPSGTVNAELPAEGVAKMRKFYAPTYDFVSERFGKARISEIWQHAPAIQASAL